MATHYRTIKFLGMQRKKTKEKKFKKKKKKPSRKQFRPFRKINKRDYNKNRKLIKEKENKYSIM